MTRGTNSEKNNHNTAQTQVRDDKKKCHIWTQTHTFCHRFFYNFTIIVDRSCSHNSIYELIVRPLTATVKCTVACWLILATAKISIEKKTIILITI